MNICRPPVSGNDKKRVLSHVRGQQARRPSRGASELRTVPVHAQPTGPAGRRPDLDPAPLSSEGFSTEEGSVPHGKDGSTERDTGGRRPSPLSWVPGTEVQSQGAGAGAAPEARAAEGASPREGAREGGTAGSGARTGPTEAPGRALTF